MTRAELLTAARRALGYEIKPDQFKAFREQGLIQRPDARKAGRPTYPAGTLRQVIEVSRLHERERRFDELRILAFWEGHWVDLEPLVRSLAKILEDALAGIREVRARYPAPEDAAEALLSLPRNVHASRSPAVRLALYRMGRSDADLRSALHVFLVLAFGGDPIWHVEDVGLDHKEESPLELVKKLTGANKRAVALQRIGLDEGDPVAMLTELRDADILDLEDPGRAFRTATQSDLQLARDHLRACETLEDLALLAEIRHGRDTIGLGTFRVHKRDAYFTMAWRLRFWRLAP